MRSLCRGNIHLSNTKSTRPIENNVTARSRRILNGNTELKQNRNTQRSQVAQKNMSWLITIIMCTCKPCFGDMAQLFCNINTHHTNYTHNGIATNDTRHTFSLVFFQHSESKFSTHIHTHTKRGLIESGQLFTFKMSSSTLIDTVSVVVLILDCSKMCKTTDETRKKKFA